MSEITRISANGRTILFRRKKLLMRKNDVLHFADGDWFDTRTGEGVHRHGQLRVTGKVRILQQNGRIVEPRYGETYNVVL